MTYFEKILVIACVAMAALAWTGECVADDDISWSIDTLLVSEHHGDSDATNEQHDGIGISLSVKHVPDYQIGIMYYTNSYDDKSTLLYLHKHYGCLGQVCFGVAGGWVSGYGDKLKRTAGMPLVGWATVKWKWLYLNSIPGEVTAFGISIPLE